MIDFRNWLTRWDAQQTYYLPAREERFKFMFDVIETQVGTEFTALDLACGPGSLSQRLLQRFPDAKVHGIDIDPILLKIGKKTVDNDFDNLQIHDIDLREQTWFDNLGITTADVALSTTALHWLPPADLLRLYNQLGDIISDGGVFLNGDHMRFGSSKPTFQSISEQIKDLWEVRGDRMVKGESWDDWWEQIKKEFGSNGLQELVDERERRFHWRDHVDTRSPSYPLQKAALYDAGFSEVDTIWQHLHNRILMAIK